nr:hypothetical protein [uncultured Nitrososphaera sp.]
MSTDEITRIMNQAVAKGLFERTENPGEFMLTLRFKGLIAENIFQSSKDEDLSTEDVVLEGIFLAIVSLYGEIKETDATFLTEFLTKEHYGKQFEKKVDEQRKLYFEKLKGEKSSEEEEEENNIN